MKRLFIIMAVVLLAQTALAQPTVNDSTRKRFQPAPIGTITPTRETPVHDPVMIKEKNKYYLFCTGNGISVFSSTDMKNWRKEMPVFSKTPEWVTKALPNYKGNSMWAPDISYHNGKYYLYYAVSSFGKNTSCIGVAINKTLDSASKDFEWKDMGRLVQSVPGRDQWNAIDPNLIIDENGVPWLVFGSFWEGIKLVKINPDLVSVAEPEQWYSVAKRQRDLSASDSSAGNDAIEAPFIFRKNNYYYLFTSWDYCCRGPKSNYKVVIGRSEKIMGPYLDKNGVAMTKGGGTLIVQGDGQEWYGAGHNAAYTFDGKDYIIYHGYDAKDFGRSKLIIKEMKWDKDGWPVIENP